MTTKQRNDGSKIGTVTKVIVVLNAKHVIEIHRMEVPGPYPRNGNFYCQAPTYEWCLRVDGRPDGSFPRLRDAKEAAKDYA